MMRTRRSQRGTTAVEFAIVGLVFFTVLFALIDLSRLFWQLAALDEATRRGTRVAAVCTVNDPYIAQTALFDGLIPGLETRHIRVEYLNIDGTAVNPTTAAGYGSIRHVRVAIEDFELQLFIPGMQSLIATPEFETTIPSESLGRVGITDVDC